jgi:hypothetical protein
MAQRCFKPRQIAAILIPRSFALRTNCRTVALSANNAGLLAPPGTRTPTSSAGLIDRQIGRLRAPENLGDVRGGALIHHLVTRRKRASGPGLAVQMRLD